MTDPTSTDPTTTTTTVADPAIDSAVAPVQAPVEPPAYVLYMPRGGVTDEYLAAFMTGHHPLLVPTQGVAVCPSRYNEQFFLTLVIFDGPVNEAARALARADSRDRGVVTVIQDQDLARAMWSAMPNQGPQWSRTLSEPEPVFEAAADDPEAEADTPAVADEVTEDPAPDAS